MLPSSPRRLACLLALRAADADVSVLNGVIPGLLVTMYFFICFFLSSGFRRFGLSYFRRRYPATPCPTRATPFLDFFFGIAERALFAALWSLKKIANVGCTSPLQRR